jgi:Tfp pilus assembly protein PilF
VVRVRNFTLWVCFCLTLALSGRPAQAADRLKNQEAQGLSHYVVGLYCEDLGDLDGAISEYTKALKADPDSSFLHLNLAAVFIKKNDINEAIVQLKQSIERKPSAVEPHALLALLYATQNNEDLAAQEYTIALENAAELEPKNIEIYKSLGAVYLQQNKLKEAESIFKIIVVMAPEDVEAHFYLASIYSDLKDNIAVERELKKALKLNPAYHQALNFLGYFYLEQDRNINQAGQMIKKAVVLEPGNGAYLDSLGWFYFKKKNFKKALIELENAASLIDDPVVYKHLGDVYLELGNRKSAKTSWDKSLKLDATQKEVEDKLGNLATYAK